ncbi:MAG TPA: magnesium transporter [Candidatus Omnitrophota bacterium]|nr:magnesium transporter [Candidatus Omnitrophota bacterium]HQO58235.1 magnesium transporter [Candidatus Omnitrophota bacterium]HQP11889.1 magnesium transporter [Candidatus Omnitrophota bacterium]
MATRMSLITPQIQEILKMPDKEQKLREFFSDMHPYDIFVLCEDMDNYGITECIKALGVPRGIDVFEYFEDERREEIFNCFSREWMADILEEMAPDDRADFVKFLPEVKREEILPLVARAERLDIKNLMEYQEGTAGSILTTDYAFLPPDITVRDAIEKIKQQAFDRETIYYIYVIDSERKLLGFVTLKDMIVAPSHKMVADIMLRNLISANVNEDKEAVAKKLNDYDFLAIPIVNDLNQLVGIVTVDDVVDVVIEETTEDIYKYGAAGEYIDYLKASSLHVAKQRVIWLLLLVFVGFVSAWILQQNAEIIERVVALSFFTTLLLGAGGNAGTQSSTVVIRGMATGNINLNDLLEVIRKELGVGVLMGAVLAVLVSLRALFITHGDPKLGITVGVAMIANVCLATTLGAVLPMLFKKINLDPALMSGPFISSIVDVFSLLIYFRIATWVF